MLLYKVLEIPVLSNYWELSHFVTRVTR